MKAGYAAALAAGIVALLAGLALAFVNMQLADDLGNMRYFEEYQAEYDTYNDRTLIGFFIAAIGAGIAVFGLAAGIGSGRKKKPEERSP